MPQSQQYEFLRLNQQQAHTHHIEYTLALVVTTSSHQQPSQSVALVLHRHQQGCKNLDICSFLPQSDIPTGDHKNYSPACITKHMQYHRILIAID